MAFGFRKEKAWFVLTAVVTGYLSALNYGRMLDIHVPDDGMYHLNIVAKGSSSSRDLLGHPAKNLTTMMHHEGPLTSLPEHHVPLNDRNTSVFYDAIDVYGRRGYVADPTRLRRGVLALNLPYWDRLTQFEAHLRTDGCTAEEKCIGPQDVCNISPHQAPFSMQGLRLMREGLSVHHPLPRDNHKAVPRILCGVYTHDGKRDQARMAALTYGWKCDGFLAFSTVTIPTLGMVGLLHRGGESYRNMIQKSRSILGYMAEHYLEDYDYFHLGGDDMHLIVENMKHLLVQMEPRNEAGEALFMGQPASKKQGQKPTFLGGPGYTLNRRAMAMLRDALPRCFPTHQSYYEDRVISWCLWSVGVKPTDARDFRTGQHRYHHALPSMLTRGTSTAGPDRLYKEYWESYPHPRYPNITVGPMDDLDAAARYSVAFHFLRYPVWMARHHAILYDQCPSDTVVGKLLHDSRPVA